MYAEPTMVHCHKLIHFTSQFVKYRVAIHLMGLSIGSHIHADRNLYRTPRGPQLWSDLPRQLASSWPLTASATGSNLVLNHGNVGRTAGNHTGGNCCLCLPPSPLWTVTLHGGPSSNTWSVRSEGWGRREILGMLRSVHKNPICNTN